MQTKPAILRSTPQQEKKEKEKEMIQEQKRIKIAEACGWREVRLSTQQEHHLKSYRTIVIGRPSGSVSNTKVAPDYFSDLNAMHEAEKVLTTEQWLSYWSFLSEVLKDTSILHATAAQRAEAFGLTLNLWK